MKLLRHFEEISMDERNRDMVVVVNIIRPWDIEHYNIENIDIDRENNKIIIDLDRAI